MGASGVSKRKAKRRREGGGWAKWDRVVRDVCYAVGLCDGNSYICLLSLPIYMKAN